ncbi:MAG: hypothetical protein U9N87_12240 [Planctomycetota bacterium]|nr:hypothetical protein [Planctomycetota bacterium]
MRITTILFVLFLSPAGVLHADAVKLGTQTQLFLDDVRIANRSGVERRIVPARKLSHPVLEPENPWEGNRVYTYGSVCFNPAIKKFQMWYMSCPPKGGRDPRFKHSSRHLVNYAVSDDGLHWEKPNLNIYRYKGSTKNNIVYALDTPSIIFDTEEPDPTKRYKMMGMARGPHMTFVAFSSDGIHWRECPHNPMFKTADTLTWTRNSSTGEYLVYHKMMKDVRGHKRRSVCLATSRDLRGWTPSKLVMACDETDDSWVKEPGQRTEFYNMSVFPYGDQFLGVATTFRLAKTYKKPVPDQSSHDGTIHGQLVHSRDGHTWHRFEDRTPFLPNGPSAFDAGCILGLINTPVIHNDEIWIYYTAITTGHGGKMPEKRITIGRAAWQLDRFVSLDAENEPGTVETVSLKPTGNRLVVNADASKGQLAVEVCGKDGKTLPGYAVDDCVAMKADELRHSIKWKKHDDLPDDRPVRLRFHLENVSLYSYRVKSVD